MFYFLLQPYIAPDKSNYQQASVLFGSGLKEIGKEFFASCNYFPDTSGNYLFNYAPINNNIEYVVTDKPECFRGELIDLYQKGKKIIIFDTKDEWMRNRSMDFLNISYKYFMTTCCIEDIKIRPFIFTINNCVFNEYKSASDWKARKNTIFCAHRVVNHTVRKHVLDYYMKSNINTLQYNDNFSIPNDPTELHWWSLTGRRYSRFYFNTLKEHRFIDAHGGYFKNSSLTSIVQWDSWKFWEGFICGCVVISADLDYYGIKLPFPLTPYKHYIPIRYDSIHESYEKMFSMTEDELQQIALDGQKYVLEQYTHKNITKYILEKL
jgi:hypothetical protein